MKKIFFILSLIITTVCTAQKDDDALIRATLTNYMHGSSYNEMEEIKSAFSENATLYLMVRDTLQVLTPSEYAAFFKSRPKGEYNGREATILTIEITKDIASAKVEILIPARKMRFIDLFLLKKMTEGWRIISKTATRTDDN